VITEHISDADDTYIDVLGLRAGIIDNDFHVTADNPMHY